MMLITTSSKNCNLSSVFIIVLHPGCKHLANFSSCSYESNFQKHWWECRPHPFSAAEAMQQQHESLLRAEKKVHNAAACHSPTALHERNQTFTFSMFVIFAITTAASALHPHCTYGITALLFYSTLAKEG